MNKKTVIQKIISTLIMATISSQTVSVYFVYADQVQGGIEVNNKATNNSNDVNDDVTGTKMEDASLPAGVDEVLTTTELKSSPDLFKSSVPTFDIATNTATNQESKGGDTLEASTSENKLQDVTIVGSSSEESFPGLIATSSGVSATGYDEIVPSIEFRLLLGTSTKDVDPQISSATGTNNASSSEVGGPPIIIATSSERGGMNATSSEEIVPPLGFVLSGTSTAATSTLYFGTTSESTPQMIDSNTSTVGQNNEEVASSTEDDERLQELKITKIALTQPIHKEYYQVELPLLPQESRWQWQIFLT
jgi:hypothetical protein